MAFRDLVRVGYSWVLMFSERYRPQFHFTAQRHWLNDPNGCLYFDGVYHLFFQHNPEANEWGNMTWGHAVSPDLVHWTQRANAIRPYDGGTIFSGSAVVDHSNSAGFARGKETALVALFTHARPPFGQALAFSVDEGLTWQLYNDGHPVVPNQGLDPTERDPKVFWHQATQRWVMVLWVKEDTVRLFTSPDLKRWTHASDFIGRGFYECPDLFELPVDGDREHTKWVLHDAKLDYWIGSFDGRRFTPEAGPFRGDHGLNFYAAQSWDNTPGRRIQIAWMRGGQYPGMPFNQQMSFPCELTLRTVAAGVRLCRSPVDEIARLYDGQFVLKNATLAPNENPLAGISGELFDIEMDLRPNHASELGLRLHGETVAYKGGRISCLGRSAPLSPADGRIRLRLLVDRTSLELFANDGEVSMTSCFLPRASETNLELYASGGTARVNHLQVRQLRSSWGSSCDRSV